MRLVEVGFGPKSAHKQLWRPTNLTLKSDAHKNWRLPPTNFGIGPLNLLECASLRKKYDDRRK